MNTVVRHLRGNAIAYVALFVALGGTGYAAANLPAGSVGAQQLKNHSIQPIKLDPRQINGSVRAWAVVGSDGRIIAGGGKPQGGATVTPGDYEINWGVNLSRMCASVATIDGNLSPATESPSAPAAAPFALTAGFAVADSSSNGKGRFHNVSHVDTFNQSGKITPLGFDLVVIC
jgi:hypothetical protein